MTIFPQFVKFCISFFTQITFESFSHNTNYDILTKLLRHLLHIMAYYCDYHTQYYPELHNPPSHDLLLLRDCPHIC